MLNTGYMHIWWGFRSTFKYKYCQHISSVGPAHYNCSFMKCDTVNSPKFFFCMSLKFNRNSGIWRISPERLQTPGGYGFGQQTCHIDGFSPPHFSSTPSSGFCGFFFPTLWNCQSSQWPGQVLSLWRWGFKMVPTKQHGPRIFEKGTMSWKKKP